MAMASCTTSYNNDKVVTGEVEYPATDPASGAFFQPDYKKNDDLKLMLDGSKDSLKLEAMKRIIGMIAKGRDASDLFPAVVKNVVSKNIEVKKLVYVYLVRYAEEQQDLALLSISTFQRALKDPNQLIRASALRVLSSIRVGMIVPIVMLAIRDSASDMSPYVRKTAAHAIPKLYSLDPEQKEELVSIIDKLLSDKAPLVVGSAAMAFSEVCPERMTLIHKCFRKLCLLLADVDEWGQLALLNVLTVYSKTFFPDPNVEALSSDSEEDKEFYSDSDEEKGATRARDRSPHSPGVDQDLRLLLRAARPLLQSRNAGVVMAVTQLFYHCAPAQDLPPVAKALIRLLRAPLEVQSVVLNSIASLTVTKRALFEPFLKSFFVRTSDPTHIKLLKLQILTNLATEGTAGVVLREFQTYVTSSDKACAAATIQAIGRLALSISSETETCLNGLLQLLSSKDEWVVCEAVVVVKRVVGGGAGSARAAVMRAAKLLRTDRLAPNARAAAVWLVAEHGAEHPRAAAILAHMIHNIADQDELVKLQLLTLAVKLSITQPDTLPLGSYLVLVLRYDPSYDVRDRARLVARLLSDRALRDRVMAPRHAAAATLHRPETQRCGYTLGTLSHYIGVCAAGYSALPVSPLVVRDAELRDPPPAADPLPQPPAPKNKDFYLDPGSSASGSEESSSSEDSSEEESEEEEESTDEKKKGGKSNNHKISNSASESESGTDSESDSASSSSEGESSSGSDGGQRTGGGKGDGKKAPPQSKGGNKTNLELLLELDEVAGALPTMTPTCGGFLSPESAPAKQITDDDEMVGTGPPLVGAGSEPVLEGVVCRGLRVRRRWLRAPHLRSGRALALELHLANTARDPIDDIRLTKKNLTGSRAIYEFTPIASLAPGAATTAILGVDFADSIQPIEFSIVCSAGSFPASVTPPVGELMRSLSMSEARWDKELNKLRGMNECEKKAAKLGSESEICQRVYETANVGPITTTGDFLRFAGCTMSSQDLVLLSVRIQDEGVLVRANCPNMAIASLLANEVANAFRR